MQGVSPSVEHMRVGETPLIGLVPPDRGPLSKSGDFNSYLRRNYERLFVEINKPGYEVRTVSLKALVDGRSDPSSFSSIALSSLLSLDKMRGLASSQDVKRSIYKPVSISSDVPGALIYINGQLEGNTPLQVRRVPGTYLVEARHRRCKGGASEVIRIDETRNAASFQLKLQSCKG